MSQIEVFLKLLPYCTVINAKLKLSEAMVVKYRKPVTVAPKNYEVCFNILKISICLFISLRVTFKGLGHIYTATERMLQVLP